MYCTLSASGTPTAETARTMAEGVVVGGGVLVVVFVSIDAVGLIRFNSLGYDTIHFTRK
jgi:hypothetical protein